MKVCVMGAGGLGSFYGAWLAEGGADVTFVARGEHLRAMCANGIEVRSALGDKLIQPAKATDDPNSVGPVDVVLFCVKNYDLESVAEQCRPLLKDDTAVITPQNGVEAPGRLARILGEQHVAPGLTYIPSNIVAPGIVEHKGNTTTLTFGEVDGGESSRLRAFRDACRAAGLDGQLVGDIEVALWTKFAGWSAASGTTTLSRQPFGALQRVPELRALFAAIVGECVAVARAKQIALRPDVEAHLMTTLDTIPPAAKTSTLVDLENGKRLELDAGVGSVARQGAELDIETPVSRTVYAALKPYLDGSPAPA